MTAAFRAMLVVGIAAFLGGCAVGRSVVPLDQSRVFENPISGTPVKITSIEDARIFELAPKDPSTPSLQDGEIGNSAITARAFARKRGGFGKAFGDILLPEGQTVAGVMEDSIGNGFRKAGYRVLQPGDQGYEQAIAVDAWVRQYWTWVNFGFWALTVHCRVEVDLKGNLPALGGGLTIPAEVSEDMQAVFEEDWQRIAAKGRDRVSENVAQTLADKPKPR
ncbi:MAG: flagellar biosynthesis protein [Rhodospirillales bacterium]|nr:flagellar biosynthesis protein [Rhodospirillales bacterium]